MLSKCPDSASTHFLAYMFLQSRLATWWMIDLILVLQEKRKANLKTSGVLFQQKSVPNIFFCIQCVCRGFVLPAVQMCR